MTLNDTIQVGRDTGLTEAEVRSAVDGSSVSVGEADTVDGQDASQLGGGPNVPDWEEDPNSPFEATQQASLTCSLGNSSDDILVLSDPSPIGYDGLQINGVTTPDYDFLLRNGTKTVDVSRLEIPFGFDRTRLRIKARGTGVGVYTNSAVSDRNNTVGGDTGAATAPITQLRLFDTGGSSRNAKVRVFALDI